MADATEEVIDNYRQIEPKPAIESTAPSKVESAFSRASSSPSAPEPFHPTARFYLAFSGIAISMLIVGLDSTSISVALPIIATALHGTAIEAFWAGTAKLVTATAFQPSYAGLSHIFGRKWLILCALTIFFVGTMIAGFSKNFTVLLVGRCVQGAGSGGLTAMSDILVTDMVPLRHRGAWLGVISAMLAIGSVSGPVVGGAFSQTVSWRWIFWINLPFIGVGFFLIVAFLRLNFTRSSMSSKLRRIDWIGTILFLASMASFLVSISWGGIMFAWSSWHTLVPLIVGIFGLLAFAGYERFVAAEPSIPMVIFANRTANLAFVGNVIHGMCMFCILYYQPLYFEAVKGYTPVAAGVSLFPATFTVAPLSIVIGIAISKSGAYRWAVWSGWLILVLGLGLLNLLGPATTVAQWIFITVVSGIGLGVLFPSLQFQLQAASDPNQLAYAVAMFQFFRAAGMTMGIAFGGVIFQNQLERRLKQYPQFASKANELAREAASLVQIINETPAGETKLILRTTYADSLHTVWIFLCAMAAAGLFLSFFIQAYDLNQAHNTQQGFVQKKTTQTPVKEAGE